MPINQEFKKIIDKIKYEHSINQAQIAQKLGVKSTYLSDMINSRVPYNDSMSKKLYEVFHITKKSEWLLTGEGEMLKHPTAYNNIGDVTTSVNEPTTSYGDIRNEYKGSFAGKVTTINGPAGDITDGSKDEEIKRLNEKIVDLNEKIKYLEKIIVLLENKK